MTTPLTKPLTARQKEVLGVIIKHIDNSGLPPTRQEIAEELGFRSVNAAEDHIKALARKGVIEVTPGLSRGLRVMDEYLPHQASEQAAAPIGLPLVGRVAAGSPILAEEHIDSYYQVDNDLFRPQADFLLIVSGMSMKKVGIFDGDLLAVHKTQEVRDGQVVVARVENEVTVKRFKRIDNKKVHLLPENDDFDPIEVDLEFQEFAIEGLAVGVIRNGSFQLSS